ncbi:MAG: hypothetical protein ACR2LK_13920 [Solirubrobacteraceae bacterium]
MNQPLIIASAASHEEAAAIVAAIERFMRDTAVAQAAAEAPEHAAAPWLHAALLEGAGYAPDATPPWSPRV